MTDNINYLLYYSNHCNHCQSILQFISNSKVRDMIHFINIDNRFKQNNQILVRLDNNKVVAIHPSVKNVPTLLIIENNNTEIYEGSNILSILKNIEQKINNQATNNNGEPMAFGINQMGSIISDNYSFLDQDANELSAKGNGGMRQMHNYVDINDNNISFSNTPKEDYRPDKIGNVTIDKIRMMRENEIPKPLKRF